MPKTGANPNCSGQYNNRGERELPPCCQCLPNRTVSENVSYNSTGSGTLLGMNVSVYHSAIDPDGTTLAMGWDTNLDGVVDVPVSASQGFTVLYIPISDWNTVPDTNNNSHMVSIAFHAVDANGGRDVALLTCNLAFLSDRGG